TGTISYTLNGLAQVSPFSTNAGSYTVVATDAGNCSSSTVVTISEPTAVALTLTNTPISCIGGTSNLTASATGGNGLLFYSLDGVNFQSSGTFNNLLAGAYTVTAKDGNNCSTSTVLNITQPTAVVLSANATDALCNSANGALNFSATGGTGTISYTVNGTTQTSPFATTAGTYTVVATDANACSVSTVLTVAQPSAVSLTASAANALCNGINGSLTFSATGGTGIINYTVNGTAQSSPFATAAGTYTIVATDANACSTSTVLTITEPSALAMTSSATNALCNGINGSLIFNATGGTGTISYTVNGTTQTSPFAAGAGTYTIVATDANACSISNVQTITQPSTLALSGSATDALCNGANGALTFNATGGSGTINYTVNGTAQTSPLATNAGSYTVVATDANVCSVSTVLTINEPSAVSLTASATNALCNSINGSLVFSATGGTGTINYTVNGTAQSSPFATAAGTYTIVATDANASTASTVLTITEPSALAMTSSATNALCNGINGSLSFNATGGTGTINYTVNGTAQSSPYATLAGTYTIVATDANACSISSVQTITEPTSLVLTATTTAALCNGLNGSLTFNAVGGTGTINYTVNGASQTSPYSNVAGTYTVVATDANACSVSTVLVITQPNVLTMGTPNITAQGCYGFSNGAFDITSNGGTLPYTYTTAPSTLTQNTTGNFTSVTNGVTYTVTLTDANGCSATTSLLLGTPNPTVLASGPAPICEGTSGNVAAFAIPAGTMTYSWMPGNITGNNPSVGPLTTTTYTVTGTDVNGCTGTATITVDVLPAPQILTANPPAVCSGQSAAIAALSIPTLPTTSFVWQPGSLVGGSQNVTPAVTTQYTVMATDVNGCTSTTSITVAVNPLPSVSSTTTPSLAVCTGTLVTMSGTGALSYVWNGPASITNNTAFTSAVADAGTYTVAGTDINGCTSTATTTLTVYAQPNVTASFTPANVCTNSISVPNASGATTYSWSGGLNNGQPIVVSTGLSTYTVTGTDANGCSATTTASVIGNVGSGSVATNNVNATMNQGDDLNATYYDPSCNLVAGIDDGLGGNVLDLTTVTLNIQPTIGVFNGQPFIRRWYQITPTSNGPANVSLYVTQADFDDYNANLVAPYLPLPTGPSDAAGIANIRITKNANTGLGNNPIVITPTVSWNGSYWTLNFSTPGFSQFRIHSVNPNNVPLPATVTSFTGRKLADANELNWITSSEQNNSHFMLQYSTDGVAFTDLAKVDTKAPNGNSASPLSYSFEHTTPALGHNYYRLKQVDIDGNNSIHAKIVDLQWGANGNTVSVYPNPTQGLVNIDVYATRNQLTGVKVLDMSGRVVKQILAQSEAGMNKLSVDLSEIAQGLYTIQVYANDQMIHVERVRKTE
ncbi:MAG: T9SS type A sorting domain-containing protein, partial [Chitinophagaceae bacterium]|nr:T9SS type A sorting domain-containing protein [Chitinophagaceae bacterium]